MSQISSIDEVLEFVFSGSEGKELSLAKNKGEERVSHEEYRQMVRRRGLADRLVGFMVFASGALALVSVILATAFAEVGSYTGRVATDFVVFTFIFLSGIYFTHKGFFMMRVFLCRFCLGRIPEGSTYCPVCRADLLSKENPQLP